MNCLPPVLASLSCLAIAVILVPPAFAQRAPSLSKLEVREAATHDELSQSLRMEQQNDPVRELGPAVGNTDDDPSVAQSKRDFIEDSTILCFQGLLTFVPKRAVLHLPEGLKDRVGAQPDVEVETWQEFYRANRGWIRTIEVTREQALGDEHLPEKKRKAIEESSSMVVATFHDGPISVLPPKEPENESDTNPTNRGDTASDNDQAQ